MLNAIIQFSIRNKAVVGLLTVALIIWGVWSAMRLPVDAVPDVTNNQVQIITVTPTLASQEVEQFVTFPIEQAVANLPDLVELRSISRFGLSVVTVVFDGHVNIWFARQLVGEKLREAEAQIPAEMGKPELAPVSTGLGEIYQYVIHPKPGSEDKYSAMDLRTMQDWIVLRQLYGTPGVAEVNSIGGILKQYEVAVSPDRLRAMNVTIPEIFNALKNNNENTGGAYIDKKPNAYFIRGIGLATSLEDVRQIVIRNSVNGVPILVGDVATVKFGHAVRYGALTYNGEKEAVGGMVMMLKGANSAEVVRRVKAKMEIIQKSLPEDVIIEPFIDRTGLVGRAIRTVEKNLVEGALIVIFVLVLFLGNLHAGLIVASAIPLSMLFALGLMNVFGVSANLMSLGAIDFGLIVDGAVIIVEAAMFSVARRSVTGGATLTTGQMDNIVGNSAKKMMNSAAFGQIIILVVYLPILALQGIEGKMFRPMAQTVSFAILGALLLSVTYVPMMSALVLPRKSLPVHTLSDRMMDFLHRIYHPVLKMALRFRVFVVTAALLLFGLSVWLFGRLGGEFIPQLQEGDYAFHCILPMGSSLSQSVETSMQAMRILKSFPEVRMVVGKTGSAEVPTDPMPPEATDMMIILKDKSEWTTTKDYNELAELMLDSLQRIPGIFFEANQPIQMRFNELMTGIRQDVAVKIFGENIDTLASIAPQVSRIVQQVQGTSAVQVERTIGLPQITIEYDRNRLANYGISVEDVNHTISTAFAGEKAGVIFENERRFDLVVRLDSAHRASFDDVSELYVPTPGGAQIPLSQVAEVAFKEGPAQISRDDGRRRIVIGFNVRERDVRSVVEEISQSLDQNLSLPTGYYYTFGGTFENLERANARLRLAVPAALLLIFILLFLTFKSFGQAALIYTAIPLSAIGGVFALMIRDMPFSISAGVGFIALFGVAVLNGIVLISTFNQLKADGVSDVVEQVNEGTRLRLRPVLMTAAVASLGFLPMAISGGAGAEVQKPLATVVIGGLITATFLTLIVLPLLYVLFYGKKKIGGKPAAPAGVIITLVFIVALAHPARAQQAVRLPVDSVWQSALQANLALKRESLTVEKATAMEGTWFALPKTGVFVENEDFSAEDKDGLWKIGLSQSLEMPGVYRTRRQLFQHQVQLANTRVEGLRAALQREVYDAYYQLWYAEEKRRLLYRLDTLYTATEQAASVRVKAGEGKPIEQISASTQLAEVRMQGRQWSNEIAARQQKVMQLMNTTREVLPVDTRMNKIAVDPPQLSRILEHPDIRASMQEVGLAETEVMLQQKQRLPEISGRVFSQYLYGVKNPVSGFSVSLAIPLASKQFRRRIEAARIEQVMRETQHQLNTQRLEMEAAQAWQLLLKAEEALNFYETEGLDQAGQLTATAEQAYRAGEISFAEMSRFLTQAMTIRERYLEALLAYNRQAIEYKYYMNNLD